MIVHLINKHILAHINIIMNVIHFACFTQFACSRSLFLSISLPSVFRLFEIPTSNHTKCEIAIDSFQLHTHYYLYYTCTHCTYACEQEYVHFIVWRQSANGFSVFFIRMLETPNKRTNEWASLLASERASKRKWNTCMSNDKNGSNSGKHMKLYCKMNSASPLSSSSSSWFGS